MEKKLTKLELLQKWDSITIDLSKHNLQELTIDDKLFLADNAGFSIPEDMLKNFLLALSENSSLKKLELHYTMLATALQYYAYTSLSIYTACLHCSNLNSLKIKFTYLTNNYYGHVYKIIDNNPQLKQLALICKSDSFPIADQQFLAIIKKLNYLQKLVLHTPLTDEQCIPLFRQLAVSELSIRFTPKVSYQSIENILSVLVQHKSITRLSLGLWGYYTDLQPYHKLYETITSRLQAKSNLHSLALKGFGKESNQMPLDLLTQSNSVYDFSIKSPPDYSLEKDDADFNCQTALMLNALQQRDVVYLAILLAQAYRAWQNGTQTSGMHALPPELLLLVYQYTCGATPSPFNHLSKNQILDSCMSAKVPALPKLLPARLNGVVLSQPKDQPMFFKSLPKQQRYTLPIQRAIELIDAHCQRSGQPAEGSIKTFKIATLKELASQLKTSQQSIYKTVQAWLTTYAEIIMQHENKIDRFFQGLFLDQYRPTKTSQLIQNILELDPLYSTPHKDAIDDVLNVARKIS